MSVPEQDLELAPETRRTLMALLAQIRFERWLMLIMIGAIGALAYAIYRYERERERNANLNGYGRTLLGYQPSATPASQQPINIYNYLPAPSTPAKAARPVEPTSSDRTYYSDQDESW